MEQMFLSEFDMYLVGFNFPKDGSHEHSLSRNKLEILCLSISQKLVLVSM